MGRYLITVGGTGQHVALAVTRLVRMGALKNDIRLIALDSDNQTDLSRLLESPTASLGQKRHPLIDGVVKAPFDISKLGDATFDKMFVDGNHPAERELFECLFSAEAAAIPIHKGMYGTPCVGATVFAEGANTPTLGNLLQPLTDATQVFVAGSVVGGTGAGMIHKLIGGIRRYYQGEIFGIFLLPWFDVPAGAAATGAITPGLIKRNSAHGLKYFYEHTLKLLTTSVLIGHPGNTQTKVLKLASVQHGKMAELPSYLHLVAARALMALPAAHTANTTIRAYGAIHNESDETWLLRETWEETDISKDRKVNLTRIVRALRVQQNLLAFITHGDNRAEFLGPYQQRSWKNPIRPDAERFAEFNRSIVNNCRNDEAQLNFMKEALGRFTELHSEVEFCITWLQGLYGALLDDANDTVLNRLAENSGAKSPLHWQTLQKMWTSTELKADPTIPRTGRDVADHHAQALLREALS